MMVRQLATRNEITFISLDLQFNFQIAYHLLFFVDN